MNKEDTREVKNPGEPSGGEGTGSVLGDAVSTTGQYAGYAMNKVSNAFTSEDAKTDPNAKEEDLVTTGDKVTAAGIAAGNKVAGTMGAKK